MRRHGSPDSSEFGRKPSNDPNSNESGYIISARLKNKSRSLETVEAKCLQNLLRFFGHFKS